MYTTVHTTLGRVQWFTLCCVDDDPALAELARLHAERTTHQRAADATRDRMYSVIRDLPRTTDKMAVRRVTGISRVTVYRLLEEGRSRPDEPQLITDTDTVYEYVARLQASTTANRPAIIDEFIADAEYSHGNRRPDADWDWPDLEDALDAARTWRKYGGTDDDLLTLIDQLNTTAADTDAAVLDAEQTAGENTAQD